MMNTKLFITTTLILIASAAALGQGVPRPPQGGQPRGAGHPPPPMGAGPNGQQRPPQRREWFKEVDANSDGNVDATEFQAALDVTFAEIDRNSNGMIDSVEMPRRPNAPERDRPIGAQNGPIPGQQIGPRGPDGPVKKMLPPFFFRDRIGEQTSLSRSDFDRLAREVFSEMDKDGNGIMTKQESRPPALPDGRPDQAMAPPPPNGQFVAAEMRFGDRLVKGQPFSAETVIEDTRRLFDGSTATTTRRGAVYRDSSGRTRREQPLQLIAGVEIADQNGSPQPLVFINDFAARTHYFLDVRNKVARAHEIADVPPGEPPTPNNAKTESLGTKSIEGVEAEGTRITFEIPVGRFGNDKPIQVVSESWFSPELQMLVYSRHLDPIAGEHIFKLVNIQRGEQDAGLFSVPAGFRIERQARKDRPE